MSEINQNRMVLLTGGGLIILLLWGYFMIQLGKVFKVFTYSGYPHLIVKFIQFFNGMITFLGFLSLATLILTMVWIIINLFRK